MDDDIQLPPLPINERFGDTYGSASMLDYGRACYEAGLADRERRAKVEAKPVVHSRRLRLTDAGHVYRKYENASTTVVATVTLRWTNDGRVWIDSERNCYAAKMLRRYGYYNAADALDGGM